MSENEFDQPSVHVVHQPDAYRVAVAQNVATNGRLFVLMLFALNVAAWACVREPHFATLALFTAIPVGLSVIADQVPDGDWRKTLSLSVIGISAGLWLLTFFKLLTLG